MALDPPFLIAGFTNGYTKSPNDAPLHRCPSLCYLATQLPKSATKNIVLSKVLLRGYDTLADTYMT